MNKKYLALSSRVRDELSEITRLLFLKKQEMFLMSIGAFAI